MIESFQILIYILIVPAIVSFTWAFGVVGGLLIENFGKITWKDVFLYRNMKFVIPILIISYSGIFISGGIISNLARSEIRDRITKAEKFEIKINDSITVNNSLVIAFKNIESRGFGERISGKQEFQIEINDMKFKAVRNFSNKNLYLIYYNNYRTTSNNPIGKIYTGSLSNF